MKRRTMSARMNRGYRSRYNDAGELLLQTAFDEPIHFLAVDGEAGAFFGTGAMSIVTLRFEVDSNGQVTALLSHTYR